MNIQAIKNSIFENCKAFDFDDKVQNSATNRASFIVAQSIAIDVVAHDFADKSVLLAHVSVDEFEHVDLSSSIYTDQECFEIDDMSDFVQRVASVI